MNSLEIINAIYLSDWTQNTVELPVDKELYYRLLQERIKTSSLRQADDSAFRSNQDTLTDRWSVKW